MNAICTSHEIWRSSLSAIALIKHTSLQIHDLRAENATCKSATGISKSHPCTHNRLVVIACQLFIPGSRSSHLSYMLWLCPSLLLWGSAGPSDSCLFLPLSPLNLCPPSCADTLEEISPLARVLVDLRDMSDSSQG